jgi:predicted transcriptional regulator
MYMASSIIGATKLREQLQMAPLEYASEIKLTKLKRKNGWNLISRSKRGRFEIMAEILYYCSQQTKTKIVYSTNLNYAQLKRHLKSLTSQGLLATDKNKYATTRKGHRFLELFSQLNTMLNC